MTSGYAVIVADAFARSSAVRAPYYVPKPVLDHRREVIRWIADAGGVAVLAHPGLSGVDDLIPLWWMSGLVGIEAYHAAHDADATARYRRWLAAPLGLIVTGGSDFHGLQRHGDRLGSVDDARPRHRLISLRRARQRVGRPMKTYFVRTFGCQMNKHDSERIAGLLEAHGACTSREPRRPPT